jgi:hypothetical protein
VQRRRGAEYASTAVTTNPLVASAQDSTTWYTGLGVVEDAAQISNGIHDNSWVDGTLGGIGGSLDIIGMAIDPARLTAGVGRQLADGAR